MKYDQIQDYCTGCGLCMSVDKELLKCEKNGFSVPSIDNTFNPFFFDNVCPANGKHLLNQDKNIWGRYINVYSGHATDEKVRFKAASGGITTAVAIYLVEQKLVDGIIQVGESRNNPYETENYISKTREEIISHCGSRYISSSPLLNLYQTLSQGGTYAIIGRPCDIIAINNYLKIHPQFKDNIYCTLSFFCAGVSSPAASKQLSEKLGFSPDKVTRIRYRGCGWPGKATVFSGERENHMAYIDSWNQILGRDIRKICKFCTDGVGEAADISSGDLWNLKNGKPIFDETEGINVVFSRSEKGQKILSDAVANNYIVLDNYSDKISELVSIQPNHAIRKKMLYPRILGMKLMGKSVPNYDMKKLKTYCKDVSRISLLKTVLGTIKRTIEGSL